jgi:ABC-type amino acid transport substrate-binding protein
MTLTSKPSPLLPRLWARAAGLLLAIALLPGLAPAAQSDSVLARVVRDHVLRVCIWPDYYGITYLDPRDQQLAGIDIDMSRAYAGDLAARVEYVNSSFASLISDLQEERCDIAMFAVGVTPERQAALRFSQPYLQGDIYGITMRTSQVIRQWDDIDQPGVNVGVQAGTVMEPVMRASLKHAALTVISRPQTREEELQAGRIDVFMTDYPYSQRLLESADWARLVAAPRPFHLLSYAYAVRPGDPAWQQAVDAFVTRVKRDGRLAESAQRHHLTKMLIPQ